MFANDGKEDYTAVVGTITIPVPDATIAAAPAIALPAPAAEEQEQLPQRMKKKNSRNSFSFARQRFAATSDFYISLDSSLPVPPTMPDLIGRILRCPNKTNGNNFEIQWCHQRISKALVPPALIPHLRTTFPKAQYKDGLQALIKETSTSAASNNATTILAALAAQPIESLLALAANVVLAAASTPPSMLAQTNAPLAAIYTAGSTSGWSDLSSLGDSQRSLFREVDDGKKTKSSKPSHRCLVCSIESSRYVKVWETQKQLIADEAKRKAMQEKVRKACSGLRRVVSCCCACDVNAHTNVFDEQDRKKIHRYFAPNMSCMEILHSSLGKEIWSIQKDHSGGCVARVRTGHRIVRELYEEIAADLGVMTTVGDSAIGSNTGGLRKRKGC